MMVTLVAWCSVGKTKTEGHSHPAHGLMPCSEVESPPPWNPLKAESMQPQHLPVDQVAWTAFSLKSECLELAPIALRIPFSRLPLLARHTNCPANARRSCRAHARCNMSARSTQWDAVHTVRCS